MKLDVVSALGKGLPSDFRSSVAGGGRLSKQVAETGVPKARTIGSASSELDKKGSQVAPSLFSIMVLTQKLVNHLSSWAFLTVIVPRDFTSEAGFKIEKEVADLGQARSN